MFSTVPLIASTWNLCSIFLVKIPSLLFWYSSDSVLKIFLTVTHNENNLLHHDPEYMCVCLFVCACVYVCLNVNSLTEINISRRSSC